MLSSVLTSGFGGTFTVDINDILLEGSSGGACFQNHFIQKYYNDFKGAAYIDCGCSQLPDDSTIAPLIDTESWRFYVLNNTEDFLYESGRSIYGYLKYTLGYEATIGDFDKIGGHCASTDEDRFEAFNWLLSDEPAPDVDFEPHFKPIEHFNDLEAIAIDDNENIWVVEEIENQVVNLHRGNNLGSEWSVVKTFTLTDSQIIKDLLYFDNYLYFDIDDEYLIKIDLSDFSEEQVLLPTLDLGDKRFYKNTLTTDHQDTLYYRLVNVDVASTSYSNNAWRSTDAGETWEYIDQIDSDVLIYVPELLRPTLNDVLSDYYLNYGNIAFDGENAWLVLNSYDADYFASMRLYKSTDLGSTWVDVTPVEFNQDDGESWYNSYTPEKIKYLLDGSLLITKGSHSWMSTDKGQSWVRVYGSSTDFSVFLEDVMSAESSDGKHTIIGFTEHEGLMYLEKTAP
ncbi:sialidase family protein [Paraglaciecola marina]|uniref:sialidase family protein n=1 Tax=Paraglaciecola marina TaxID=2500157 RepID=UPI00105B4999|nr:sialidase family protein [Paraglaciecola marina]